MTIVPLTPGALGRALTAGWRMAGANRGIAIAYAGIFAGIGVAIIGGLLASGLTPLLIPAAGAFMLVGPVLLAGFFGIAADSESGGAAGVGSILAGFRRAAAGVWVIALVCALVFMIFATDVATLYSYMVGGEPVALAEAIAGTGNVATFLEWSAVSGAFFAFLVYSVAAFSVPLLCEGRATLVGAVATSVKVVFGNLPIAILWGALLAVLVSASALALPLLPLTLPWLAFASRALYRETLPPG